MKIYHLISNPVAGKNKAAKNLQKVQAILDARGIAYHTHFSQRERDAVKIANTLTRAGETEIVAIGGDGTLHEVLNGLHDPTACRLGLVPSGTGNDFAEHVGLPLDAEQALSFILDGEAKETDFLEVGGTRCMNVGGLGMDVDVLERCKQGKLKGKIKYLMSLLQSLFVFKGYRVEVIDGERTETHEALLAAVCNGSQFGGGIRICPVADEADGKMNAVIVDNPVGKGKIIKSFISLMKGKILEKPIATHFLCESLKIIPENPCTIQLDGELYKGLEFDAKICRGLRFYRP